MRLYFDTTQPNYTRRLPTIRQHELICIVYAYSIMFEDNEFRNFVEI